MRPSPYLTPMPLRGRVTRQQPKGLPVINMGFNELPYPPAPSVSDAMIAVAKASQSYGAPRCDALRDKIGRINSLDPEHIICGNGSEDLLDVVTRCFARPRDEVLISQFGYIQFALTANRVGARLVKAPERDFTTDPEVLLSAITEATRVIFLANPNNPTGTMLPVSTLAKLCSDIPPHIVIVLDLAYGEFANPEYCAQVHNLVADRENVIVTRTFSKAYGLAGVRVGWAHAAPSMIQVLYEARAMGPVNAVAQAGALAALEVQDIVTQRVEETKSERDRMFRGLTELGFQVIPSQTNFLMLRHQEGSASHTEALVEDLFDRGGFVVNRTREAGLESFMRVSLHLPDHNDAFIEAVSAFLAERA